MHYPCEVYDEIGSEVYNKGPLFWDLQRARHACLIRSGNAWLDSCPVGTIQGSARRAYIS